MDVHRGFGFFPNTDPGSGSRGQKATDLGSGSATLLESIIKGKPTFKGRTSTDVPKRGIPAVLISGAGILLEFGQPFWIAVDPQPHTVL